ncbi:MAG: DUF4922 domain-containing protein [Candidatus Woesearchaeota archaeon]
MRPDTLLMYNWDRFFNNKKAHIEEYTFEKEEIPMKISYIPKRRYWKKKESCPLDKIDEDEVLTDHDYTGEFSYVVNRYPICRYSVLLVYNQHVHEKEKRKDKEHIKKVMELSELTGTTFAHNMENCGASIPEHEHFQGVIDCVPVMEMGREIGSYSRPSKQLTYFHEPGKTLIDNTVSVQYEIPWEHAIFRGEKALDFYLEAIDFIEDEIPIYTPIFTDDEIHLIPRSNWRTKEGKSMGALEFCGMTNFTSKDEYEKAKTGYRSLIQMRMETAFPRGSTKLQAFLQKIYNLG